MFDVYSALPVLSVHLLLSGYLAVLQRWPLNTGSTVYKTAIFKYPSSFPKEVKSFFGHLAVDAPESDRKDLLSQLKVMKTLKPHPHVIKLLGCVTDSGKELTKILSFVLDSIVILDLISHSYH